MKVMSIFSYYNLLTITLKASVNMTHHFYKKYIKLQKKLIVFFFSHKEFLKTFLKINVLKVFVNFFHKFLKEKLTDVLRYWFKKYF